MLRSAREALADAPDNLLTKSVQREAAQIGAIMRDRTGNTTALFLETHEAAQLIAPRRLIADDALYAAVQEVGQDAESLTWSVVAMGRPRKP